MKILKFIKACIALPIVLIIAGWYLTFLLIAAMPSLICQCFCLALAQLFGLTPTYVIRDVIHQYVIAPVFEMMHTLYKEYR